MGLLDGALTGLLGGGTAPTPSPSPNAAPGLLPTLSLPGLLPTLSLPGLLPTLSLPGISIPGLLPTTGSSSVASVTAAGTSSPASSSSPLSTSTTSSPSLSPFSFPPTSTVPLPTTALQDVTTTGSNGVVQTLTNVVTVDASSASQSATAAPAAGKSFLQNKPLSGTVFALVGLLALILIITVATFAMRRRARNRLLDDAVSFDPGFLAAADSAEKGHARNTSFGTMSSGRPMVPTYGNYRSEPVPAMPAYPEYYGGQQQQPYLFAPPTHAAVMAPHNIPRVPVPTVLPAESGSESHQANRDSIEETEFWARTLKVTND